VLADVMLRLFHLSVAEETYQGGLAGLSYSIDSSDSGISFGFSGYNQRMGEWIERLVRKFAAFKADADQLVVVLDEVVRGYRSFNQSQPYQQGMYYAGLMIYPDKFSNEEYLRIITDETPTAADVDAFHAKLLAADAFTEAFVHGNVQAATAIDWCNEIHSLVKGGALPAESRPIPQAREWSGEYVYAVEGLSPTDPNAALVSSFAVGTFDPRRALVLGLLASVLNEPTYNQLRTIEQLGYLVFSGASIHAAEDTMGFYIAVQSPWSEPGNISHSVDSLVHGTLEAAVRGLSDEHFERERAAVIANKLAPFEELSEEAGFYAGEIGLHRCHS
jgi:insulysin